MIYLIGIVESEGVFMKFNVKGKLRMKDPRTFSKIFEAVSENMAREKTYSFFGSNHKLPRNKVIIESLEEIK